MSSIGAIRDQLRSILQPTTSFAGQTIIVTGSNTGLGLEAARHFVRLTGNATRVILAVRLRKKGEAARASIKAASNRENVVEVWQVDMSIQDFVAKCNSLDRLDVVANAGVLRNTYEELGGTEITIKVNVIGTFLLVVDILPMLRRSRENTGQTARLVITSSVMHEDAKFAERHETSVFDAFNKDKKSYISDRYNTSKLLELFLTCSIAATMHKGPHATQPVILDTVNPGLCHSELDKDVKL